MAIFFLNFNVNFLFNFEILCIVAVVLYLNSRLNTNAILEFHIIDVYVSFNSFCLFYYSIMIYDIYYYKEHSCHHCLPIFFL